MGIDVPGSSNTVVSGINDAGQIVGRFTDAAGLHGFLLRGGIEGTFTPIDIDVPGSCGTLASGINNAGQIVGTFGDADRDRGFLATHVPLMMLSTGILGLLWRGWR